MNHLYLCNEKLIVDPSKVFISFIGQGSEDTIISWNNKGSDRNLSGQVLGMDATAPIAIKSNYLCARYITFQVSIIISISLFNTLHTEI